MASESVLLLLSPGVTSRTDPGLPSHSTIVGGDGVLATGDAKNMNDDDKNPSNIFLPDPSNLIKIFSLICQPNYAQPK